MIKCQVCGIENPGGSQFCDECGAVLNCRNNGESPIHKPRISEVPIFQSTNVTSVGVPAIADVPPEISVESEIAKPEIFAEPEIAEPETDAPEKSAAPKVAGMKATLMIERGDSIGTEFALAADESNIGRWDADNGIFPDVDLDSHDAEAKISRRHARIIHDGDNFMIEDLGSTNGTYVNRGRRLIPGTPHLLNDGDEIIVGKTFLRFYRNE